LIQIYNKKGLQLFENFFVIVISAGVAVPFQTKLRFENQKRHKIKKQALYFACFFNLYVTSAGMVAPFLTKLRFENSTNKKTLKQARYFFLCYYLFVTSAGMALPFLSATI